jgi:23S rRNA (guanosine2251-2'-O)-methyltransferase
MSMKKHRRGTGNAPSLPQKQQNPSGGYWIYGRHAVSAALANPERKVSRILVSAQAGGRLDLPRPLPAPQTVDTRELDRILGAQAVHQGIAAQVAPLAGCVLEDVLHLATPSGPLLILDQVSDPHNVGAVLRSAAAFDATGVILPKDHSAPETAVMAKAACGALDLVPLITVTNLAASMRELKEAGWWIVGLDGTATELLTEVKLDAKTVLVLGAEGKGMRRLTQESCDFLARLPISSRMESLNVSNAAAIALYQLYAQRGRA